MENKKKLLFITPSLKINPDSGGLIVTVERLRSLTKYFDVHVLTSNCSVDDCTELKKEFSLKEISTGGKVRPRTIFNFLKSLFKGIPLSIFRNTSRDFLKAADKFKNIEFDLIVADHWLVWHLAELLNGRKKILHLHNAEHLLFHRAAEDVSSFFLSKLLKFEATRVEKYLMEIVTKADETHYLSPIDQAEVEKLCKKVSRAEVFYPTVSIPNKKFGKFGKNLLFIGTMSWQPNLEGIRWFVDEVAPLLPLEYSTTIVGGFPDDNSIDIHSNSRIKWVGRVDDLSPYYIDASVFIAPLKSGSGIKLKLLNSLAHAIPTVTTSIGIEGFPVGWGNAIKIGDTPEDFVKKIIELCESQFHWESCRDNGLKYLSYNFSTARFDDWIGKNLND